MSLLGTLEGFAKKLLPSVASMIPGIGPVAGAVAGGLLSSGVEYLSKPGVPALPSLTRTGSSSLPPPLLMTRAPSSAKYVYNEAGQMVKKRRRRAKGISGHDLKSFKRVARLIDKFAAPVHHLKKSSFKHKER